MMLSGDKDKALTLIFGGKKPSPEQPENVTESYDEGFSMAAQEILAAVEGKNVERLSSALKSFFGLCGVEHEKSEEE